jgi:hypothetical protein
VIRCILGRRLVVLVLISFYLCFAEEDTDPS